MAPFDGFPSEDEWMAKLMTAIDTGCRLLWNSIVAGNKVTSPDHAATVLAVFADELEPRREGDVLGGIKFATFFTVSRALCQLLTRTPPEVWDDAAQLETHKQRVLNETLASCERNVLTKVLGKKLM